MRAGNCSAAQELAAPRELNQNFGAAEYIPSLDSLIFSYQLDYTDDDPTHLFNMSSPSDPATLVNTSNWWYNVAIQGGYFLQSNGTLWAVGQSYGFSQSVLYQLNLGNNITAIREGAFVNGFGINTILPRAVRPLSDGPVPTAPVTKWRTGYAGAIAFVTPDNDLFVLNIDVSAIRNVTRLPREVLALESLGGWNQIYAIVNGTTNSTLVRVDITNGALTTVAELPAKFQSLARGTDGKLLAMSRLESDGNITIVEVSSTGSASQLAQFQCLDSQCQKVWSDGTFYYFAPSTGYYPLNKQNITGETVSVVEDTRFLDTCIQPPGPNGCANLYYTAFGYTQIADVSYHAPTQGALIAVIYEGRMTGIHHYNLTTREAFPVMDFHHKVSDMAYFQYDAAWCSNRGTWNGDVCVCNNAGIVGSRCETVLPAPVAPPVAAPAAAPVAAPVAVPAASPAGSGAPTSASTAPKAVSAASTLRFGLVELAFVVAIVFAMIF
jgi:hypothetical protein